MRYTIDPATGCWTWQGSLDRDGYPTHAAHRRMYVRHRGPVPPGLQLDHTCRSRACVNPDHLEPVTRVENCRRRPTAKLSAAQVARIKADPRRQVDIAAEYGVSQSMVSHIKRGVWWRDVEPVAA